MTDRDDRKDVAAIISAERQRCRDNEILRRIRQEEGLKQMRMLMGMNGKAVT